MINNQPQRRPHFLLKIFSALVLQLLVAMAAQAQWTTPDASQNINNTNSGNVGVGTTTPSALLEVKKSQNASTTVTVDNPFTTSGNNAYSGFVLKQNGVIRLHVASVNDNHSFITPGTAQFWNFANAPTVFATNNTEQMRISATGNVGIGSNAPDVKLQIHHFSTNTNLANIQLADLGFVLRNTSNTNGNLTLLSFQDAAGYGNANIGVIQKDQTNHSADMLFLTRNGATSYGERMRIRSDGKVGIGTTIPTAQLQIATASGDGEALRLHRNANTNSFGVAQFFMLNNSSSVPTDYAQISGGIFSNTAGSETGVLAFYTRIAGSLAERMRVAETGNVGIGMISPTTKLDVNGTVNATAFTVGGSAFVASQWATSGTTINYATGNVGVGTPSPSEKLHVTGNLKVSGNIDVGGNINAKYQDVAEWVESSQELLAGTVVVLDATKSNQVIASTESYDSRVAGVISPQPGIALGERGDGRVLVAATGRVRVRVDATNGPIQIGDLLVTSEKEGTAMKSMPVEIGGVRIHRPGTLIGKALEPLAKGTGEILVLLSLQ